MRGARPDGLANHSEGEGSAMRKDGEENHLRYSFKLADGRTRTLTVSLDAEAASPPAGDLPAWTALEFEQCSNCPLQPQEHPRCPAAVSVMQAIDRLGDIISYEEADVRIESPARIYEKHTSMQDAASSLMGVTLATSGCPILGKLRPMARYHLPFSNIDETQYRVLSMYLLAQYFRSRNGEQADWELQDLRNLYEEIRVVNEAFSRRLGALEIEDTNRNAIAILDALALMVSFAIDRDKLDQLEQLFAPYLADPPAAATEAES